MPCILLSFNIYKPSALPLSLSLGVSLPPSYYPHCTAHLQLHLSLSLPRRCAESVASVCVLRTSAEFRSEKLQSHLETMSRFFSEPFGAVWTEPSATVLCIVCQRRPCCRRCSLSKRLHLTSLQFFSADVRVKVEIEAAGVLRPA